MIEAMTGDHPNAAIVRRQFENQGSETNPDAWLDGLSDDVEWHEIGQSEAIRGKQALRDKYMGANKPDWEIVDGSLHDVVANDEHVVALLTATGKRGDQTLEYRVAEIYHMKDGKITKRWAFSDDTKRIADFFA
jgi:ketosteroid isomerase-like protein